jgi:hypothetical protein
MASVGGTIRSSQARNQVVRQKARRALAAGLNWSGLLPRESEPAAYPIPTMDSAVT